MKVLLLDTETTGLDFNKDRIIEFGVAVTSEEFGEPIETLSWFCHASDYPPLTPEITKITGITADDLALRSRTPQDSMTLLGQLVEQHEPEFVVAYNMNFDKSMFLAEVGRGAFGMLKGIHLLTQVPWLCAMRDVEANYSMKCWKLSHLCLDHGLMVDPTKLHRALDDVLLMRRMLRKVGETASNMFAYQSEPELYVRALTTPPWEDGGKSNAEARAAGYSWEQAKGDQDGPRFEKSWVKKIKSKHFAVEEGRVSFPVRIIK